MRWPTLFVSHGSPMLAVRRSDRPRAGRLEPGAGPQARAILVVSPHWMGHGLALSTRDQQVAWHDFGGFPPELYTLQYAAPGSPELAARAQALLADAGIAADRDPRRPLDHGAWVPLRYLYPEVDVPVVRLSLDMERDAAGQLELGRALALLRDEDVLIIGSGSLTHNLRDAHAAGCAAGVVCAGVPAMVCRPSGRP